MLSLAENPEFIKARLKIAGSSLAKIARDLDVSVTAVSRTIRYENCRSHRIECAVAAALGVEPASIWPARYQGTDGVLQPHAA